LLSIGVENELLLTKVFVLNGEKGTTTGGQPHSSVVTIEALVDVATCCIVGNAVWGMIAFPLFLIAALLMRDEVASCSVIPCPMQDLVRAALRSGEGLGTIVLPLTTHNGRHTVQNEWQGSCGS
jgi:hypothetical protein